MRCIINTTSAFTTSTLKFHMTVWFWQILPLIVEFEMKNLPTKTCRMSGSVCPFFLLFCCFSTQVPQHDVLQRCGHLGLFLCLDCCCLWSLSGPSRGLPTGCLLFLATKYTKKWCKHQLFWWWNHVKSRRFCLRHLDSKNGRHSNVTIVVPIAERVLFCLLKKKIWTPRFRFVETVFFDIFSRSFLVAQGHLGLLDLCYKRQMFQGSVTRNPLFEILLMVQKSGVHQLICSLSHYIHPKWLVGFLPSAIGDDWNS